MNSNLKFDNEMKDLSMCVYKGNEKYKPKDWIKFDEHNANNGFHGEAFYKNDVIVISFRGTDQVCKDLIKEDLNYIVNNVKHGNKLLELVHINIEDDDIDSEIDEIIEE